ncbi:MAG: polyamine aminopropyltransferase [Burkholderiales bacterium]|nr:polyamine aminopropyltransferase [Burkholderiales bacterium]
MSSKAKSWFGRRSASVEVSEEDGVRSLHLGGDAIQSSIRLDRPDELALDYTRAMMAFLLFLPQPREALMIGLGGGSMARYIHQRMPGTRTTVVEINARVLAAARSMFHFPADDARLSVEIADGADYVAGHAESADVLLVDGFDDGKQPPALCTQAFYDAAYAALRPGGVMTVNFMAEEKKLDVFLQRIENSFDERVICLKAADRVNLIAFAFKGHPRELSWAELKKRAQLLKKTHDLPFEDFITGLKELNPHTRAKLRLCSAAAG